MKASLAHPLNGCLSLFLLFFLGLFSLSPSASAAQAVVLAVELQGPITPASDDIVAAALQEAEREGSSAVMLLLDTPGGGLTETAQWALLALEVRRCGMFRTGPAKGLCVRVIDGEEVVGGFVCDMNG